MRKNGKYRFSLQFPAETEEQIQAGELLERLGNRKSAVVVAALWEYLLANPALLSPEGRVEIKAVQNVSSEQLKEMVRKMLDERLMDANYKGNLGKVTAEGDNNITEMLNNMDIFGQIQRNCGRFNV